MLQPGAGFTPRDARRSAAGVGERAVLPAAVMADRMHPQHFAAGCDLHCAVDDRYLDLAAPMRSAGAVADPRNETQPAESTLRVTTWPTVG